MQGSAKKSPSGLDKIHRTRYARHLSIPEIGPTGQQKLLDAKVLVVGAGGLGSPVLQYLAAAGVGTLGILDFDRVDESNLQRQVLFGMSDLGRLKAEAAADRLCNLNPDIEICAINQRLTSENALTLFEPYDLVIDGSDNFPTRYLVNDTCVLLGKPFVYGAIFRFEGQVAFFNAALAGEKRSSTYRDLFPEPPDPGSVPSCAEAGVLGVLPGIVGSFQANEAIKWITGIGDLLVNKMLHFDAKTYAVHIIQLPVGNAPRITELMDYEAFCQSKIHMEIREITVQQLAKMQQEGEDYQLIDVREPYETEISTLDGLLIPPAQIESRKDEIQEEGTVVLHCRSGKRSANAIAYLQQKFGYQNLYNLKGGILAWADEIDQSMKKY